MASAAANAGLPADTVVCFANTGKEVEATLRFVRECSIRWQVPIQWLEYRDALPGFAVVDFASASRQGEPFEALIRKRQYLPNPVARGCTTSLKIREMHKFVRSLGWTDWDQFIGIRAASSAAWRRSGRAVIPQSPAERRCACRWPRLA